MGRLARAARQGDSDRGLCTGGCLGCPHLKAGRISAGSGDVLIEGKGAARLGDSGDCQCPHAGQFRLIEGSATVFINGKPAVRVRDGTQCQKCGQQGTIITGANTVFIG